MPVTDTDLTALAASHDIINLGMLADAVRRERHGVRTTFLRVADVPAKQARRCRGRTRPAKCGSSGCRRRMPRRWRVFAR